jgi:hypothetical protein
VPHFCCWMRFLIGKCENSKWKIWRRLVLWKKMVLIWYKILENRNGDAWYFWIYIKKIYNLIFNKVRFNGLNFSHNVQHFIEISLFIFVHFKQSRWRIWFIRIYFYFIIFLFLGLFLKNLFFLFFYFQYLIQKRVPLFV